VEIRIKCDPEYLPEALDIMKTEAAEYAKYTKQGWGWDHGNYQRFRLFVRKTVRGLSGVQVYPKMESGHD
jgi:hypothetical protein